MRKDSHLSEQNVTLCKECFMPQDQCDCLEMLERQFWAKWKEVHANDNKLGWCPKPAAIEEAFKMFCYHVLPANVHAAMIATGVSIDEKDWRVMLIQKAIKAYMKDAKCRTEFIAGSDYVKGLIERWTK